MVGGRQTDGQGCHRGQAVHGIVEYMESWTATPHLAFCLRPLDRRLGQL